MYPCIWLHSIRCCDWHLSKSNLASSRYSSFWISGILLCTLLTLEPIQCYGKKNVKVIFQEITLYILKYYANVTPIFQEITHTTMRQLTGAECISLRRMQPRKKKGSFTYTMSWRTRRWRSHHNVANNMQPLLVAEWHTTASPVLPESVEEIINDDDRIVERNKFRISCAITSWGKFLDITHLSRCSSPSNQSCRNFLEKS